MNADLLKGKITAAGYTQLDLARLMHMSKNTMNAKVLGKRGFRSDEIMALCELLNITSDREKVEIFLSPSSAERR